MTRNEKENKTLNGYYPERVFIKECIKQRSFLPREIFAELAEYTQNPEAIRNAITPSISVGKNRVCIIYKAHGMRVDFEIDDKVDYTDEELALLLTIYTYKKVTEEVCTRASRYIDYKNLEKQRNSVSFFANPMSVL